VIGPFSLLLLLLFLLNHASVIGESPGFSPSQRTQEREVARN